MSTVAEGLRVQNNALLNTVGRLEQTVSYMLAQVKKIARWEHVPETPATAKRNAASRTPPSASLAAKKSRHCNSPPEAGSDAMEYDDSLMNQKLPPDTININSEEPPPMATTGITLRDNYNNVDTGDTHGGTNIQDIITSATFNGTEVTFMGLTKPARFKDNAKFNHCCSLFAAVATPQQKELLLASLPRMQLQQLADEIAEACILQLTKWEGKESKNSRKGYAGVGLRVQKIKVWNKSLDLNATAPLPKEKAQDNDDNEMELATAEEEAASLEAVSAAITVNVNSDNMQQKKLSDYPKKPRPITHRLGPKK